MTELPYSGEVLQALMADYTARWAAVVVIAWLLGAALAVLARVTSRPVGSGRAIGLYLAALWIWIGIFQQWLLMADVDFMAPVYGALWLFQGLLFLGAVWRRKLVAGRQAEGLNAFIAPVLIFGGLVLYPAALLAQGWTLTGAAWAGTAPAPTLLVTCGFLAGFSRPPWVLFILPTAWAVIAAVNAYLLPFEIDYVLAVAILAALAVRARDGRRRVQT